MIRFLPDTWSDALLRPIAMAAPDAGVYAEIMAPDARFAVAIVLTLAWIALAYRLKWRFAPVQALLAFVTAAFAVWLATTGNGRYFIPMLLAVGPLCIALIHRLPATRGFRAIIAVTVVGIQAFIISQNTPWHSWQLAPWASAPFFEVTLDEEAMSHPATYVTATSISYSLIAPKFPAASRWVNISSQPDPDNSVDGRRVQALLAAAESLQLLIPSMPDYMTPAGRPGQEITKVINGMLAGQRLMLKDPSRCRLLPSRGLASQALQDVAATKVETLAKFGFWVCPLEYPVKHSEMGGNASNVKVDRTFEAIENACPRLFPPREAASSKVDGGFVRNYSSADMKLYVLDDGRVFYKYWRAINPALIGSTAEITAGNFKMDCNSIRGRSGLPWNRQL